MGQCFEITVPNTNVTLTAGAGAVDGITFTTDENAFHHAGKDAITEAGENARIVAGKVLGAVAGEGVVIGTPCTIQATAGGAVQIYAGAGIPPSLGSPSGPGGPLEESSAPEIGAGERAANMNKFNDAIKGAGDMVGAGLNFRDAANTLGEGPQGLEAAKAAHKMLKSMSSFTQGGWDVNKAVGAENEGVDMASDLTGYMLDGAGIGLAAADGDFIGAASTLAKLGAGVAAEMGSSEDGETGDQADAADDGPRIHQVAPANIDRECGADMTAKVGGDKKTDVDGDIKYQSAKSVSVKAFNKISTQSLFFGVHANVSATMTGLAQAKVESLGKATLDGKVSVTVSTMGKGKVEAKGRLDISTNGVLDMGAKGIMKIHSVGAMTLSAPDVEIKGEKGITAKAPAIELKGKVSITDATTIKGDVSADKKVSVKGDIKGSSTIKNKNFTAK